MRCSRSLPEQCPAPASHLVVVGEEPKAPGPDGKTLVSLGGRRETLRGYCGDDLLAALEPLRGLQGVDLEVFDLRPNRAAVRS